MNIDNLVLEAEKECSDIFKEIDFLVSLNISEDNEASPYMVKRDFFGNCVLYNNNPIINNFFNYFKAI